MIGAQSTTDAVGQYTNDLRGLTLGSVLTAKHSGRTLRGPRATIKTARSTDIRKHNACLQFLSQRRLRCQILCAMSVETEAVNYFRI